MSHHDDGPDDAPIGKITFDERGNAVWRPYTAVESDTTLNRLLRTDDLAISDTIVGEGAPAKIERGIDPYSSGFVERRKGDRRKTDLRALSAEIVAARRSRKGD